MGLGSLGDADSAGVSLAQARDAAVDCARLVRQSVDPIEARRKERADQLAAQEAEAEREAAAAKKVTFVQATHAYLKDHAKTWKHVRADKDWLNPLRRYAFPIIGGMPLDDIQVEHVRAARAANATRGRPAGAAEDRDHPRRRRDTGAARSDATQSRGGEGSQLRQTQKGRPSALSPR
jgi:hypothetical protein